MAAKVGMAVIGAVAAITGVVVVSVFVPVFGLSIGRITITCLVGGVVGGVGEVCTRVRSWAKNV